MEPIGYVHPAEARPLALTSVATALRGALHARMGNTGLRKKPLPERGLSYDPAEQAARIRTLLYGPPTGAPSWTPHITLPKSPF